MGGKYSWIVLFVTLQISVVLCRSTEKPKEEVKVIHEGPILFPHGQASVVKSIDQYFADNFGEPTPESPVPSEMSYDVYIDEDTYVSYNRTSMTAAAIVGLIIGIFCIISLIIGCVLLCCCQKEKRRPGRIISSNTGGQTAGMQQPGIPASGAPGAVQPMQQPGIPASGAPGAVQPMQQYPPTYGQAQSQNIYPAVHPSN